MTIFVRGFQHYVDNFEEAERLLRADSSVTPQYLEGLKHEFERWEARG